VPYALLRLHSVTLLALSACAIHLQVRPSNQRNQRGHAYLARRRSGVNPRPARPGPRATQTWRWWFNRRRPPRVGVRPAQYSRCQRAAFKFPPSGDPGCECFADFIGRVRHFEQALCARDADKSVIVFTHGLVMHALLWFRHHDSEQITGSEMATFDRFRRSVSVPNCAVLWSTSDRSGRLRLSTNVFVAHIPEEVRTE
jgi:hypothetical protein